MDAEAAERDEKVGAEAAGVAAEGASPGDGACGGGGGGGFRVESWGIGLSQNLLEGGGMAGGVVMFGSAVVLVPNPKDLGMLLKAACRSSGIGEAVLRSCGARKGDADAA